MNPKMRTAQAELTHELEKHEPTRGMYVRVHGDHLIIGRAEILDGIEEGVDRVRLTRLGSRTFGLSVKRHTGRWERTPFSGPMTDMVDVMCTVMQHLVAVY
jgi:hypothetical protein